MPAQAPGDMRQDGLPVLEFDREGRAGEDLLDRPEELERRFLGWFFARSRRAWGSIVGAAGSYGCTVLEDIMPLVYPAGGGRERLVFHASPSG
jgi:hypothetical protein